MLSSTISGSAEIVPRGVVVEAVARVAFESQPRVCAAAALKPSEFAVGAALVSGGRGVAPGAGMQFDHRRLQRCCRRERFPDGSMNRETRIPARESSETKGLR